MIARAFVFVGARTFAVFLRFFIFFVLYEMLASELEVGVEVGGLASAKSILVTDPKVTSLIDPLVPFHGDS